MIEFGIIGFIFSLIPPIYLILQGYGLTLPVANRTGSDSLLIRFFISLVAGVTSLVIPMVIWATFADYNLSLFLTSLTIILGVASLLFGVKYFTLIRKDFSRLVVAFMKVAKGDLVSKLALVSFAVLVVKVVFYLYIVPINVDALYFYLPTALYFLKSGHVYPYTDHPVVPTLYAWSYPMTFGAISEPFRQIPSLFIISFPLLVYAISRLYISRRYSLVALILAAFSPFLDTGTWLWPWQTDFIAGAFFSVTILLLLKDFRYRELFMGLSLSMSILSKTSFGLAVTVVVFVLAVGRIRHKVMRALPFMALLTLLLAFGFVYSFSVFSAITPSSIALPIGIAIIVSLTVAFSRHEAIPHVDLRIVLLDLSPVVLWTLRQVYLGGSPFALPIFSSHFVDTDWWQSFVSQISGSTSSLSAGYSLVVFLHPLIGLTVLPLLVIGLYYAFRERGKNTLFIISILFYFLFLAAFSLKPSFRHLYPMMFFILPIAVLGLSKIFDFYKLYGSHSVALITLLLVLAESTQNLSVQTAYREAKNPLLTSFFSCFASQPAWLEYRNLMQLQPFFPITALCVVIVIILPFFFKTIGARIPLPNTNIVIVIILPFFFKTIRARIPLPNTKWVIVQALSLSLLIAMITAIMILPLPYSAVLSTNGNLSAYSTSASWYNYQIDVANDLGKIVKGGRILTFGFDAFYYLAANNLSYYDLWRGSSTSFPFIEFKDYFYLRMAFEAKNLSDVKTALYDYFEGRYVLLPTNRNYIFDIYERFSNRSKLFEILQENNALFPVKDYGCFELYQLKFD